MDEEFLASGGFSAERRLAWVLATNRIMAAEASWAGRSRFIRALQDDGLSVDHARLSRWESGSVAPSTSVLTAYETRCGLPEHALVAINHLLHRMGHDDTPKEKSWAVPPDPNHLDDLFDRLDEGLPLSGGEWLHLSAGIAHAESVYLPTAAWQTLCSRLINELTRSSGLTFVRRHEAVVQILRHRRAPRHVMRALGTFVLHPHAQSVVPALTLLREVGSNESAELIIRLMTGPDRLLRRGASVAAAGVAAQGSFTGQPLLLLEKYLARSLRGPIVVAQKLDLFDIATQLPVEVFERMLDAADAPTRRRLVRVRMSGELVPPAVARSVADHVAGSAETALGRYAHDPDLMLRRLLREALFHVHRERRQLAASVLSMSPYGPSVAKAALELTAQEGELTALTSWSILRRLGHLITREEIGDALRASPHPSHVTAAMITMGLATGPISEPMVRRLKVEASGATTDALRHAALFALGMSGDAGLEDLAVTDPNLSDRVAWWRKTGAALVDDDVLRSRN